MEPNAKMRREPCPACPDGNEWSTDGPTGRACPVCKGKAYMGEDEDDGLAGELFILGPVQKIVYATINTPDSWDVDEDCCASDSDYCACSDDPIEEESATGHCFACGKELPW